MGELRPVPLAITTADKSVAGQEYNQNVYPEKSEGGKYPFTLRQVDGYVEFANLGVFDGIKALHKDKKTNRLFAFTSKSVYEVFPNGGSLLLGSVDLAGERVSVASNGLQVVAVDGIKGYYIDEATNTVEQITSEAFYPAKTVAFQDGFFIFDRTGTNQFFVSGINAVTFDALDFGVAQGSPDNVVAVKSDHRELFIFCTESIEVWYNSGAADFAFERSQGVFIEKGLAARYSVAKQDNTLYFVASDFVVYSLQGYTPVRISTHAVEVDLARSPLDDAFAETYSNEGHLFYVLTIPSLKKTWIYDISTRAWFVRKSQAFGRHVMSSLAVYNEKTLIGDFQTGKIYHLTRQALNDNGDRIIKQFVLPVIAVGRSYLRLNSFEIDMLTGVSPATGISSDAQAVLELSKDNGRSWGSKRFVSIGKIGEYRTRVIWRQLGLQRQVTPRVTISADVQLDIGGAWVDVGQG